MRTSWAIRGLTNLAKKGADTPFTGPEPVLSLPYSVVKREIGDWMERNT